MCDSAKMEVYLNPVKYCKTPTGHPKGHPCCKIADYDDTALGTGTLTVHPWRAGPDCGKLLLLLLVDMTKYILQNKFSDHESQLWQINENSALINKAKVWMT